MLEANKYLMKMVETAKLLAKTSISEYDQKHKENYDGAMQKIAASINNNLLLLNVFKQYNAKDIDDLLVKIYKSLEKDKRFQYLVKYHELYEFKPDFPELYFEDYSKEDIILLSESIRKHLKEDGIKIMPIIKNVHYWLKKEIKIMIDETIIETEDGKPNQNPIVYNVKIPKNINIEIEIFTKYIEKSISMIKLQYIVDKFYSKLNR